ncbi:MAG: hypothetical protein KatS3mg023_3608 [Armatimonadota bacterium]|jgi:hypothetical protein|nr:MAG: hypothetical protein KatS3mg023_3608 [Armatimonadota bacterium]
MESRGSSDVGAVLELKDVQQRDEQWLKQAAAMLINGLLRVITSGNVPAEVHVDPSKIDLLKELSLQEMVSELVQPGDPNEGNVRIVADWWDGNRSRLVFVPRDGMMWPYVVSVAEQAEATVFAAVFQQLQSRGLEQALAQFGLDLQTLMRSPKLVQDTVWFQFQLMLHDRLKSSIITPQEIPLFKS